MQLSDQTGLTYTVTGSPKQQPERKTAEDADWIDTAFNRSGVVVYEYFHVSRVAVTAAITEGHLTIHHPTVPLLHRGTEIQLQKNKD